jgi:hypothetical protein
LNIHEFNNRKADIERHAKQALEGLEKRVAVEKLPTAQIIERAYAIGRSASRDMANLEAQAAREFEFEPNEDPSPREEQATAAEAVGFGHLADVLRIPVVKPDEG